MGIGLILENEKNADFKEFEDKELIRIIEEAQIKIIERLKRLK
jgi:hypothetical protein